MKVEVRVAESFKKAAKPLIKKFRSFLDDLSVLEGELKDNPEMGVPLGNNSFKIRLKIKSKGKGKSGGARVISYVEKEILALANVESKNVLVSLITIYDKSEKETITDAELGQLIENLEST
jgi:mRNA-degrading endonuclease RelE of RelBE toxin-antitoxin system